MINPYPGTAESGAKLQTENDLNFVGILGWLISIFQVYVAIPVALHDALHFPYVLTDA